MGMASPIHDTHMFKDSGRRDTTQYYDCVKVVQASQRSPTYGKKIFTPQPFMFLPNICFLLQINLQAL